MKRILFICAFLLSLIAIQTNAQTPQPFTLQGVVVDSNGEPIVGAMVYVKDKPGVGAVTDADGQFSIKIDMYSTVGVSFVGYDPVEKVVTSKSKMQIVMNEGTKCRLPKAPLHPLPSIRSGKHKARRCRTLCSTPSCLE